MKTLIEQFDQLLIDLAWSLWTELGVAGINRHHKDCLIAIEELIVLTAVIAKSDPRLRDEALDWCSRYHHFVSISRLKTLIKAFGESIYKPYSLFAITLNSIADTNWPILLDVKPLNVKLSGKSKPPDCKEPALLGLRLRALYGVGARADLFTDFLIKNNPILTASDAANIGYSKRSLAELLDSFVQSGVLNASLIKNQKKYELLMPEELRKIVGRIPKKAPPWRKIIEVLFVLRITLQQCTENSLTSNVVAVRNTLIHLKDSLHELNLSPPSLQSDLNQYWESFTKWLLESVNAYAQGNFRGEFEVKNKFEETILSLMQYIYNVDDCLDGLEIIICKSKEGLVKHSAVFKEGYQLCLNYVTDLDMALRKFLEFPFHLLKDFELSDIPYKFSKYHLQLFLKFTQELPPLNHVTNPRIALIQYEKLEIELNKIHQFIYEFKERLKKVFYLQTDVNLLTLSSELYRRHFVLKLFSGD